jgi:hypothetical protein
MKVDVTFDAIGALENAAGQRVEASHTNVFVEVRRRGEKPWTEARRFRRTDASAVVPDFVGESSKGLNVRAHGGHRYRRAGLVENVNVEPLATQIKPSMQHGHGPPPWWFHDDNLRLPSRRSSS